MTQLRLIIFSFFLFLSSFLISQSESIEKNLAKLKTEKIDTSRIKIMTSLCYDYAQFDLTLAEKYGKDALALATKVNYPKGATVAHSNLGIAYWYMGKMDLCEEHFRAALNENIKQGEPNGIGRAYMNIANLYYAKGNYDSALYYHKTALPYKLKGGKPEEIAQSYHNIALIYADQGNLPKALEQYFASLKLMEKADSKKGIAMAYNNIGNVLVKQQQNVKALEYYKKSLELKKEISGPRDIAFTYNNMARIYEDLKQDSTALDCHLKALALRESIHDTTTLTASYNNLGLFYQERGEIKKAEYYHLKALAIREGINNPDELVQSYINLGTLYGNMNQMAKSEMYTLKANELALKLKNTEWIKESYRGLGELYAMKKNWASAYKFYRLYKLYTDSLLNENAEKEMLEMETKYQTEKKQLQIENLNKEAALQQAEIGKKDEAAKRQALQLYSFAIGFFLVLALVFFVYRGYLQKQKSNTALEKMNSIITIQKEEVEMQKKMVEEKNTEITDSINYAKRIQYALLAHDNLLQQNLPEHFVFFQPKDIVSGDFYWATKNEASKRFYLAVCDSTGHGVPGAFMSLLNISFLNEAINEKKFIEPNEVLNHVRQRLIENISHDGGQDGMDGILISFAGKNISYSAAHNAPLRIRNDEMQMMATDKMPIGKGEKTTPFTLNNLEAQKGDVFYFYTDGFADQFGGPYGKKFKHKHLQEILFEVRNESLSKQKEKLEQTFQSWKGSLEQVDDVCIIGIRI